ncbi:MAG: dihydroorotase [Pseudomonadota bacterium]
MSVDLVIKGGWIVGERGRIRAGLAVEDGRIVAIAEDDLLPPATTVVDAAGLHLLPGVIDVHVHFREPGMAHKETWTTGSRAAAAGGVTTVFDMPNTDPPVDTVAHLDLKHARAREQSLVDFGLYGLLGEHNLEHLAPLAEAGVVGYKLFLGNTTGNLPCPSDGAVREGFEILAELGLRCSIHAENSPMLFWREARLKAAGRNDPRAHLEARDDLVAVEALNRACTIAEWTGARIHIVHESTSASLPYIAFFKQRGVDLTVETLPQYLVLSMDDVEAPGGAALRMNPPIRDAHHQAPLWEALASGLIDMIATDHAPHGPGEKTGERIWDIACGLLGVETSLPLMLTEVNKGRLTLEEYVRVSAGAPARAFGLYGRKGVLRVGADADIVLVDLERHATLGADRQHSLDRQFPYEGRPVQGLPVMTFVRGRLVAKDGEPVEAAAGWGRMVRPTMPMPRPRNVERSLARLTRVPG